MHKIILKLGLIIFLILIAFIFYLSEFGIKTKKFNELIIEKIKETDSRLSVELDNVFLKLNLAKREIKVNTSNSKIYLKKNFIELSNININLDLFSILNNKKVINDIEFEIKEHSLKNFIDFIKSYKFNLSQFLIYNRINNGRIKAKVFITFNELKAKYPQYKFTGQIKDADFNIYKNTNFKKINFNFNIEENNYDFKNLKFYYNKIKFNSKKIQIAKKNKDYLFNGNLMNEKSLINLNNFFNILKLNFDFLSNKEIILESNNDFKFKFSNKKKIEDLEIKSSIRFDKLFFSKKYKNLLYLHDGIIETNYQNNNLNSEIKSKYSFVQGKDIISNDIKDEIKISLSKNKNKNYFINGFFKSSEASFNIANILKQFEIKNDFLNKKEIIISTDNLFSFQLDKKNKIQNLNIKSKVNFQNLSFKYNFDKLKKYFKEYQNVVFFKEGDLRIEYENNELSINGNSKYSLDKKFDNFQFSVFKKNHEYKFNADLEIESSPFYIKEIEYEKSKNKFSLASIKGTYGKEKILSLDNILFKENNNLFEIKKIQLNKKLKILNIKELKFNYLNKNNLKNNIKLSKINDNYQITGNLLDFSKFLNDILKNDSDESLLNNFKDLDSVINIKIDKVYLDNKNSLIDFKGMIHIKKNKISNANLKSNFKNGDIFNFSVRSLDDKKITTLYTENAEPFVQKFDFIKGFENGVLEFESIKKNNTSKSVLKIDNFKVKEVPVLAQLLTLASLQGIADSLTGEGIRFTDFEMIFSNKDKLMKIDEIYAIGPAISIMMSGYIQSKELVSLRGTLVPARTINRTIASIPVLGDILVGKKVGEGVFGVSFKIKGPPKDLKTSVNPIKTLTPRFITRTLEKIKK